MHAFVETLNRWGAEWSTLAVALVWQSTLVALLVLVATYALARSSPAVRYWLWQIVAIKLLILPVWSLPVAFSWLPAAEPIAQVTAPENEPGVSFVSQPRPTPQPIAGQSVAQPRGQLAELSWRGWLLASWAIVVLLQIGQLGIQRVRLAWLLRRTSPADERVLAAVSQTAARLQLVRAPRAVTADLECSPFVCGIVRPTLVLPRGLAKSLTATELEQVVAHELAHVKRRDLVWGWIPQIAQMLWFFHPVAYLASYRVRLERELACDQMAMITAGRGAAEYADTLVRVLSSTSCPSIFRTSVAAPLDGGQPSANQEQQP